MKRTATSLLVALLFAGWLLAHHSLNGHDTSTAVRVKGTVVEFHQINPHSIIFVMEKTADGQSRRWAIEGPSVLQLTRTGFAKDSLKPGDVVEACGYLPKEPITWQIANPDPSKVSLAGRLLTAEVLTLPDGKTRSWGDYGFHKCFAPGYTDQHDSK